MASAFVQEVGAVSNGSAGSSLTWTGSVAITAGNTLVVYVAGDTPMNIATITASGGVTTWSHDVDETYALHNIRLHIYRGVIASSVTLTSLALAHDSVTERIMGIVEFSGVASPSGYDVRTGTSSTPNADVDFNAVDGIQLWVAAATDATNALSSYTPPSGYTLTPPGGWAETGEDFLSIPNDGSVGYRTILAAHRVGAASGTHTASAGASTMSWVTASGLLTAPVTKPALAGISMDGVTIR